MLAVECWNLAMTSSERFWAKVTIPADRDSCWEWAGALFKKGYGRFGDGKRLPIMCHRFSYQDKVGPIPNGLSVLHSCDNRKCVNPRHLFLGTHVDNMADMVSKRRSLFGIRNPRAKLTEADVIRMRELILSGVSSRRIASMYGVAKSLVLHIKHGRIWSHVP